MNVLHLYKDELYIILNINIGTLISKRTLSRYLEKFIHQQGYDIYDAPIDKALSYTTKITFDKYNIKYNENMPTEKRYINMNNNIMKELTGIINTNEWDMNDWWDLVTIIYKRYKI